MIEPKLSHISSQTVFPVLMLMCETPSKKDFSNDHQDETIFHLHDNLRKILPNAYLVRSS